MNWKTIAGIVGILALLAGVTACAGYTISDYIKVPVPPQVQDATGSKPTEPLSRAPFVRERYVAEVSTNLAELDANIEDAQLFADFAGSLLNTGLEVGAGPIQSLPAGGLIFAALGGLVGLFTRKPGTAKEIEQAKREEHEKTWDAAVKETIANLAAAK